MSPVPSLDLDTITPKSLEADFWIAKSHPKSNFVVVVVVGMQLHPALTELSFKNCRVLFK